VDPLVIGICIAAAWAVGKTGQAIRVLRRQREEAALGGEDGGHGGTAPGRDYFGHHGYGHGHGGTGGGHGYGHGHGHGGHGHGGHGHGGDGHGGDGHGGDGGGHGGDGGHGH